MNFANPACRARIFFSWFFCLFLAAWPLLADAPKDDDDSAASYEKLVRQNVQMRQDLKEMNEKYQSLESERTLLITRLKDLQVRSDAGSRPSDLPANFQKELENLKKRLAGNVKKLQEITQERDRLQKSLEETRRRVEKVDQNVGDKVLKKMKEKQEAGTALFKTLQEEKNQQAKEIENLKQQLQETQARENDLKTKMDALAAPSHSTSEQGPAHREEPVMPQKAAEALEKEAQPGPSAVFPQHQAHESREKPAITGQEEEAPGNEAQAGPFVKMSKKQVKAYQKELKDLQKSLEKTEASMAAYTEQKEQLRQKILNFQNELKMKQLKFHFGSAIQFEAEGLYKEALREYLLCLEIDPEDSDTHYNLGILYDDKLHMNQKAADEYRLYLQYCPKGEDVSHVKDWIVLAEEEARLGVDAR
jgi:DNA repair exonuclease SbcCD ATPase subunit